jgi:hypothetical protein
MQAALSDNVLDALTSALIHGVAGAVGSYGASRIGEAFHAGRLDAFSQHVLHAGVGAGTALITGGILCRGRSAPWWAKLWQAPIAMAPLAIPP